MNSLTRSLIEKDGYDNGFEIVKMNDSSLVSLSSSLHPITAQISAEKQEGSYVIRFSENLNLSELKRGLNKEIFQSKKIVVWNREFLGVVLRRAAELGISLPDTPLLQYQKELENKKISKSETSMFQGTEREQIVKQRIGQNVFRAALIKYWKGCCAITSIDIPEILRASHIKPWSACNDDEDRLNVYNGILLSANYDALFDKGLISFDNEGTVLYSNALSEVQVRDFGGDKVNALHWIDEQHLHFLKWHRENIFK
jgi:predicted restriction endonuclease